MKILITGGAGFIGSHLVKSYLNHGWEVSVLDNFSKGKLENLPSKVNCYSADVRDKTKVQKIFKKVKPEFVNHLAAQTKVTTSISDTFLDAEINILGLISVLEASAKGKVQHFTYASSGGVIYGETPSLPINEETEKKPASGYGISKLTGEKYVTFYQKLYGFKTLILRYSNVYGPRQLANSEGGVVAILIDNLCKGTTPTIYGNGNQSRDFVFVKDIAKLNVILSEKKTSGIFNVGTGKKTSVNELYLQLTKVCSSTNKPIIKPERPGEILHNSLDISKLQKIVPDFPFTDFRQGLKDTISWYKNRNI